MGKIKTCNKCGVPLRISKDFVWRENGVISQTRDPDHRLVFYESDNFDDLFKGIEELIGMPIEHIVTESKRRSTREYVGHQFPPMVFKFMHRFFPNVLTSKISAMGRCYGVGSISLYEIRNKGDDDDFQTIRIRNPYSVPLFCGDSVGSKEAMAGRDFVPSCEEVSENVFLIKSSAGKHPIELQERLERKAYAFKSGDIEYERCPACGVPLGVARCHWDLEEGTIYDPDTDRRMVMIGPSTIDAIMEDLKAELGEDILEAAIEVQRRFIRKILQQEEASATVLGWREMAGLRGLGFVREIDIDKNHMKVVFENSCLDLFLVGNMKGIFETVSGNEKTTHHWERHDDGDLIIEITA